MSEVPDYDEVVGLVDPTAIIVTVIAHGERAGCLVTFNSPCSIAPPQYAVWLAHTNRTYDLAMDADSLVVHLLTPADRPLAELFGGVSSRECDKFADVKWDDAGDGTPVLPVHGGWLHGRIVSTMRGGDHTCFVLSPTRAHKAPGRAVAADSLRLRDVGDIKAGNPV